MKASLVIALLLATSSAVQLRNDSADADDLVMAEEPQAKSNDQSLADNKQKEDNARKAEAAAGTNAGAVAPPGFQAEDKSDDVKEAKQSDADKTKAGEKKDEFLKDVNVKDIKEPTVITKNVVADEDTQKENEKAAKEQQKAEQENPKVKNVIKNKMEHHRKHGKKSASVTEDDSDYDHDVYFKDGEKKPTVEDQHLSGFHGAEEDEIMEKIIKAYSDTAKDPYQQKTDQMMLSRKSARRAAEVALEACHKLSQAEVPAFIEKNFEAAWDYFDQNKEGWIRYEESFQFLRHLFGTTNKFAGAPGSISDLESGGKKHKLPYPVGAEKTPVGKV